MQLSIDQPLPFPASRVFRACRDDLSALSTWLPHVDAIERVRHEPEGELVRTAYRWTVRTGVPSMLRGILGAERFCWTDHAHWNERQLSCSWWTESEASVRVRCAAEDTFEADGSGGTLLRIRGELRVEPQSLAVPRAVQSMLAASLERFLVRKMQADVARTMRALAAYLASDAAQASFEPV